MWTRREEAAEAEAAAAEMTAKLGIPVTAMAEAADAVRGADIVVTTTPATKPILRAGWLAPGQHVTAMGSDAEHKNETRPGHLRPRHLCRGQPRPDPAPRRAAPCYCREGGRRRRGLCRARPGGRRHGPRPAHIRRDHRLRPHRHRRTGHGHRHARRRRARQARCRHPVPQLRPPCPTFRSTSPAKNMPTASRRTRRAMEAHGIDTLIVSDPSNMALAHRL